MQNIFSTSVSLKLSPYLVACKPVGEVQSCPAGSNVTSPDTCPNATGKYTCTTCKPVLSDHLFRCHGHRYLTGCCLLMNKVVQKAHAFMSFLHYFDAAISNHLSGRPKNVFLFMVAQHRFDCNYVYYVYMSLVMRTRFSHMQKKRCRSASR